MKALSIHPIFALGITLGFKTVECRSWTTSHRGDLLICATARKEPLSISGHALAVAEVTGIEPFTENHLEDACMLDMPANCYAWLLDNIRLIEPFKQRGQLNLYNVDDSLIKFIPNLSDNEILTLYYEPLIYFSSQEERDFWRELLEAV